jgi:hypothetical protein
LHDILCLTRVGLCAAGAAGLGGFLGENVLAFVPALISGAAGVYALTLLADADTEADLAIEPGQVVHVKAKEDLGRAPRWGAGSFALAGGAVLTLEGVDVSGQITVAAGADLTLDHVALGAGACVGTAAGGRLHLVGTPSPVACLSNVIIDTADIPALVAAVGGGLPGTFVLRLAGAGPFEVPALDVHADQDVRVMCTEVGSLDIHETVTLAAGAAVSIGGAVGSLAFGTIAAAVGAALTVGGLVGSLDLQGVTLDKGTVLTFGGEVALIPGGLFPTISFTGDGSVAFDGALTVLGAAGTAAGTVTGGLPGTITLDLAVALVPGGATGVHSTNKASRVEKGPFGPRQKSIILLNFKKILCIIK